jgi:cytosine permease
VNLFFGALVAFAAGMKIALLAGIVVAVLGSALGWLVGHVGYKSGTSSTVLSRRYGFGHRGSALASVIFGIMIIGFLALENALLYKGLLFYFNIKDTLLTSVLVYSLFTFFWIMLTAYGFSEVTRVSSVTLFLFLLLLGGLTWRIAAPTWAAAVENLSFDAVLPPAALASMGALTPIGKFAFSANVLMGSAGALSLLDADVGRYSRRSLDIGLAAIIGNVVMDVLLVAIGGAVMHAARPALEAFYVHHLHVSGPAAQGMVLQSPDSIAAVFIIFAGAWGTTLMFLAQTKAQVINTYSASLSLSNLGDVLFGRTPGRMVWIIVANIIGLCLLYGKILQFVNQYISILGVVTTGFAGLIIADYYIVKRGRAAHDESAAVADVNWPGVITILASPMISIFILGDIIPFRFLTTLALTLVVYPALTAVWPKATAPRAAAQRV